MKTKILLLLKQLINMHNLVSRIYRRIIRSFKLFFFQFFRKLKYRLISGIRIQEGVANCIQPCQINGRGKVVFSKNVTLGVIDSPFLYSGYIYIEARCSDSIVQFGENVIVNNNATFISEGDGIFIGDDTIIGFNFNVFDSDFHSLSPTRRRSGSPLVGKVNIGENVFIGANVTILKGVSVGANSVIASGSVVSKNIPENVIAAGIPAKVIKVIGSDV